MLLGELTARAGRQYVPVHRFGLTHLGLDDKDRAIEWLERTNDERSSLNVWMKVEAVYDSLRSDAGFQQLFEKMGLHR